MSERLAHNPLDPITIDCPRRYPFGDRQAQASTAAGLTENMRDDPAAIDAATSPERTRELLSRSEPAAGWIGRQSIPSSAEPLAALSSARVQNLPAPERFHASSKAVRAVSTDLRRLICALHLGTLARTS